MTHTPTPWKSSGPHILARIDQTSDVVLAKTFSNGTAAFIVRACNAHDALVEAASEYLKVRPAFRFKPIGCDGSAARRDQEDQIAAEDKLIKALKLARGEV